MLLTLFEIGTWGFWVLFSVITIILICLLSNNDEPKYGWSITIIIVTFILLYNLGAKKSLQELGSWVINNPFQMIGMFILYLFIGIVWSFAEWYWFVNKKAKESITSYNPQNYKPKISKEKGRIFAWIFYWPWVMLWKMIHKPFERLFNIIYTATEKTYNKITENAFKEIPVKNDK